MRLFPGQISKTASVAWLASWVRITYLAARFCYQPGTNELTAAAPNPGKECASVCASMQQSCRLHIAVRVYAAYLQRKVEWQLSCKRDFTIRLSGFNQLKTDRYL